MNTQTVTLDVTKRRQVMPEIRIGQGDKDGTTLVANIYDNGEPFTLTSYSVRFAMKLPFDMAYWSVDGTVSGNTATFAIDESYAASVAGVTETAYVEVLSGSTVICSTNRIRVVCLESAYENVDPAHLWDNGVEQFLEDAQDTLDAAVAQAQSDVSDAVDDADAATTRATQAAEAAEGVVLDALPTMTANLKGGAKLGSGLEIDSDTLSIDLTDESTGESVTAADASYLASLTVDGKAVQDGTPTPSAPVDVQVVQGVNLLNFDKYLSDRSITHTKTGSTYSITAAGSMYTNPLVFANIAEQVTISADIVNKTAVNVQVQLGTYSGGSFTAIVSADSSHRTVTATANALRFNWSTTGTFDVSDIQLEAGSTATPYTPYGSIGLKVGSTITPINLNGNVLASLPDGTKDVLTVDSVGHCVFEKRVGVYTITGNEIWPTSGAQVGNYYRVAIANVLSVGYESIGYSASTRGSGICDYTEFVPAYSGASEHVYTSDREVYMFASGTSVAEVKTAYTGATIYYTLATPQTIDLGYIDMPAIPDGSTISITAQVTPTITASWWARGAAAIAEALKTVRARIDAIEAAIAELATA